MNLGWVVSMHIEGLFPGLLLECTSVQSQARVLPSSVDAVGWGEQEDLALGNY